MVGVTESLNLYYAQQCPQKFSKQLDDFSSQRLRSCPRKIKWLGKLLKLNIFEIRQTKKLFFDKHFDIKSPQEDLN